MPALTTIHWQSVVDFLVLAVAIYLLLRWSREARALRIALTIFALRVGALLAGQLDLLITSWVLDASTIVALLALIVVFQPELRRALTRFDITGRALHRAGGGTPMAAVAAAAWSLAQSGCGALIVIGRKDSLAELVTPGVTLGGLASQDILEALFQRGSPVHDGAAIIEGPLIARVGAILPLTQRSHVPEQYGTRHRAGLGLAERSDALTVVVSEERGEVTLMWENQARLMSNVAELRTALTTLMERQPMARALSARALRTPETGLKAVALALAALVWSVTFLFPGHSVRMQTVPIEFANVPPGLTIAAQSSNKLDVWLRGSQFLFDTVDLNTLVARCDLAGAHPGMNAVSLGADALDVPSGIRVEGMTPLRINVRLESSSSAGPDGSPPKVSP